MAACSKRRGRGVSCLVCNLRLYIVDGELTCDGFRRRLLSGSFDVSTVHTIHCGSQDHLFMFLFSRTRPAAKRIQALIMRKDVKPHTYARYTCCPAFNIFVAARPLFEVHHVILTLTYLFLVSLFQTVQPMYDVNILCTVIRSGKQYQRGSKHVSTAATERH